VNWENILLHLPYCYGGRRTFIEVFALEESRLIGITNRRITYKDKIKALAKSPEYTALVNSKISPSEIASGHIGNIYTGSIFLGMLSTLSYHFSRKLEQLANKKLGFMAYW